MCIRARFTLSFRKHVVKLGEEQTDSIAYRTKSAMVPIPEGTETYTDAGPSEFGDGQDSLDRPTELAG